MKTARKYLIKISVCLGFTALSASCDDTVGKQPLTVDKNRLVNINKYMVDKDFDIIRHFIMRKSWQMSFSDKGYYYEIINAGNNPKAKSHDEIVCSYVLSLLDGTICYQKHNQTFIVDRSDEISGLHDAVKLLGAGDRARFIFPSHLAYGLQGDFNKIPPRSILICSIQILTVK